MIASTVPLSSLDMISLTLRSPIALYTLIAGGTFFYFCSNFHDTWIFIGSEVLQCSLLSIITWTLSPNSTQICKEVDIISNNVYGKMSYILKKSLSLTAEKALKPVKVAIRMDWRAMKCSFVPGPHTRSPPYLQSHCLQRPGRGAESDCKLHGPGKVHSLGEIHSKLGVAWS